MFTTQEYYVRTAVPLFFLTQIAVESDGADGADFDRDVQAMLLGPLHSLPGWSNTSEFLVFCKSLIIGAFSNVVEAVLFDD